MLAMVAIIVGMELLIALTLGILPPTRPHHWRMLAGMVGGPIGFTALGMVTFVILRRLGIDLPTDVPPPSSSGSTDPPAQPSVTEQARSEDDDE